VAVLRSFISSYYDRSVVIILKDNYWMTALLYHFSEVAKDIIESKIKSTLGYCGLKMIGKRLNN
jgi:hypothetical protein